MPQANGKTLTANPVFPFKEFPQDDTYWQHIIDALPAAVYTTDADGVITYFNQAAVEFSGNVPELGTERWCVTWKLFYPDGTPMPHDQCPMAVALKEGRVIRGEEAILERPDGTRVWFTPFPTPLRDSDGRIIGGINMLLDITSRKRSEENLRRSERELSDFFENAPVGLHWVGPDGIVIRVNQRELNLLGYSAEEYVGHHISEFHADQEICQDILSRLEIGEELENYEADLRCKDGSIKHVLINSNVLWEDGRFVHSRCFTRDITDRKIFDDARFRLSSIVESSHDAIISKDLNTTITSWNVGAEILFGYTAEEAIGRSVTMLIPPENADEEPKILGRIRRGERIDHYETVRMRKDGTRINVSLMVSPIYDASGRIVGASKIARDISSQINERNALAESEQRLLEWTKSLESQVVKRTIELQDQTIRLRNLASELTTAEQRERKRLAAMLHDDLQQSLVAAKMQLNCLGVRVQDDKGKLELRKTNSMLGEAINSARDLTRQLRPPALYEDGLFAALRWLASEMQERYRLHVLVSGQEPSIPLTDDMKAFLFQCVRELLFNVAKHAGVGEASVDINQVGDSLRLIVKDEGHGFDSSRTKSASPGGFGLFSIRERVASLGGSLTIESQVGKGTRAQILLATTESSSEGLDGYARTASETKSQINPDGSSKRPVRVILVDDHPVVREGIANILRRDPRIQIVGELVDGLAAVEALEKTRADIILLDVNMPRMNGIEAARVIHRRWPEVRIIGLSVQDDETTAKSMVTAGASVFLTKTTDVDVIISTIMSLGGK